jgi:prolyl 4-hydroxylase
VNDVPGQARLLLERNDIAGAAALLKRAEEQGDALAARELALWCLAGTVVRRDLRTSRALFERAAELGDSYSASVTRAFLAAGVGGPSDWTRAMALLREAASRDAAARAQLKVIEQMQLDGSGNPLGRFDSRLLSNSPEVRLFPSLFSAAECDYLIAAAEPTLRPSFVIDPASGKEVPNPVRTSGGTAFPFVDENPAVNALNRRLAAASGTDVRSGEPLQVLRYEPGQQYRNHSDALPGVSPAQQRVLTFLVFLNEDFEGGETAFPHLGLKVRGRRGDGLLFRNASAQGIPEPRSLHAGLPVTRGVKHLASRWIRATPLIVE